MRHARPLIALVLLLATASAQASSYTLRRGETLSAIAARVGVSVGSLARANGVADPDRVRAGQRLRLPQSPATVVKATPVVARRHLVVRGENLTSIARRYGTTVKDLVARNGLRNGNHVRIGQRLVVPGSASAAAPAARCPVLGADRWAFVDNFGAPRPGGRRHAGIDIFARRGTPVVAPVSGIVRRVPTPIGGLAVELIAGDGTRFYFAHLHGYGATGRVAAGAVIGSVGTSGNAAGTPPHLHLEWYPGGGGGVNPYAALRQWCR